MLREYPRRIGAALSVSTADIVNHALYDAVMSRPTLVQCVMSLKGGFDCSLATATHSSIGVPLGALVQHPPRHQTLVFVRHHSPSANIRAFLYEQVTEVKVCALFFFS